MLKMLNFFFLLNLFMFEEHTTAILKSPILTTYQLQNVTCHKLLVHRTILKRPDWSQDRPSSFCWTAGPCLLYGRL